MSGENGSHCTEINMYIYIGQVHEMLADVKSVFQEMVTRLDWMDAPTKAATLDKVRAMRSFIGFPEWLLNVTQLNNYYDGVGHVQENVSNFSPKYTMESFKK